MKKLLILLFLLMLTGCITTDPGPPAKPWLDRVNSARSPVQYETELERMANDWANNLCSSGSFFHRNLSAEFNGQYGRYTNLGEVILKGPANFDNAMDYWMQSPTHREVIVDPVYNVIGIGHNPCGGNDVWVMDLGRE